MSLKKNRVGKYASKKILFLLVLVTLTGLFFYRIKIYRFIADQSKPVDYTRVFVRKVTDGDTIILSNYERVRLIGIDTPELYESDKLFRDTRESGISVRSIRKLGEKSYRFTKKKCEHKYVKLEFDYQPRDKYGRLLAYVFLDNDSLLNEEIIRQGYGLAYLRFPFKEQYRRRFIDAESEAKSKKNGLWNQSPGLAELEKANR